MERYVVRAMMEPSGEIFSVLSAASMAVHNGHVGEPGDLPVKINSADSDETVAKVLAALTLPPDGQPLTVTVNAPTGEEAVAKASDALRPWGDPPVELLGEEPL